MAKDPGLSKTPAKAAVDALVDSIDTGTGTAAVLILSGTQPASPDTAITTQNTLATIEPAGNMFGAAATGTAGDANYIIAEITDATMTDTSADATGTATWFRAVNKSGVAKIDGSIGTTTDFDMQLNNDSINAGQTVKITAWKVRLQFKN